MQAIENIAGIAWRTEPEQALQEAQQGQRAVYVFVYRPGCSGCRLMDEGTFKKPAVHKTLANWICVRLPEHHSFVKDLGLVWYPQHWTFDAKGQLLRRHSGYLPADEFLPWLLLVEGDRAMRDSAFDEAADRFRRLTLSYPASGWAPEAGYWLGAARYLATGEAAELNRHWRALRRRYPDSLWAHKVQADWRMPRGE